MLRCILLAIAAVALISSSAFGQDASRNPQDAPTGAYEQNSYHTVVAFCTGHMEVSTFCGRFNKTTARLNFNGSRPERSTVTATIDLNSVDTTSDMLDEKLRRELFRRGSIATFRSTAVRVDGNNQGTITGTLAINGVIKPVALKARFIGGKPFPFADKYMIGFNATGGFRRSDFGLTEMPDVQFAGDIVTLTIDIEFLQVR